ncbi:MAG: gfo/Idh/MocA family oxidoreductase, partial [Proteobacteria bacterium]
MHSPFSSVRVAVVGAGIGRAHIEGYLAAGAQVATICDLTPDKARALAQKWNIEPSIESDFAAVLS